MSGRTLPYMMIPKPNPIQDYAKRVMRSGSRWIQGRLSGYTLGYNEDVREDRVTIVITVTWPKDATLNNLGRMKELQDNSKSH